MKTVIRKYFTITRTFDDVNESILKKTKSVLKAFSTFALLLLTTFSGFAASQDSTFSIVHMPESRYAYSTFYKINPDGKTVTVTGFGGSIGKPGGYGVFSVSISGKEVTNPKTGWRYTVTQVGDGKKRIADFGDFPGGGGTVNIYPGVERINDHALDSTTKVFNVEEGCKIAYFGRDVLKGKELRLHLGGDCEFNCSGGILYTLELGDISIKGNKEFIFSKGLGKLITCTSAVPPRIDTPLFEDAQSYEWMILIVPDGSQSSYRAHQEWGKFARIMTQEEYDMTLGYIPAENEFLIRNEDYIISAYRINDDGKSVRLVNVLSKYYKSQSIDCNAPVVDPESGKSYTLTGIGNGSRISYTSFDNLFNSNITYLGNNSLIIEELSRDNKFKYVGYGVVKGSNYGFTDNDIYINQGCYYASECISNAFNRIGKDVVLSGSSSVFPYPKTPGIIKCLSSTPPETTVELFPKESYYKETMVYIPEGSLSAYRNHEEWGKFENLFEVDQVAEAATAPTVAMTGSGNKFTVQRRHSSLLGTSKFTFGINPDNETVSLLKIEGDRFYSAHELMLDKPVTDPSTGKEYLISAIGDGENSIGKLFNSNTTVLRIPENIRYLNSNCFDKSNITLVIGEENNLRLLGDRIMGYDGCIDTLVINPECYIGNVGLRPNYTKIYGVERLGKGNIFTASYYEADNPGVLIAKDKTDKTIECMSKQPPVVNTLMKEVVWNGYTTLIVPKGCYEIYRAAPEWGMIQNIIESENAAITVPEMDSEGCTMTGVDGGIRVSATGSHTVTVHDIHGRTIRQVRVADGSQLIELPAGFYIVTTDGVAAQKLLVK